MSKQSQEQYTRCNVFEVEIKEKKNASNPHYILQCQHSPQQKFPILTLP